MPRRRSDPDAARRTSLCPSLGICPFAPSAPAPRSTPRRALLARPPPPRRSCPSTARGVQKPLPLARFLQAPAVATPLRVLPPQACASLPCRWTTGKWTRGIPRVRAGMPGGNALGRTRGRKCPLCCLHPPAGSSFSSPRTAGARRPTPSRLPSPHPLPPPPSHSPFPG